MDKLNICLISSEYPPETLNGGIGTYTFHLAHGLAGSGHKVSVITKAFKQEREYFDRKVHVYQIKDHKMPFKGFGRLANLSLGQSFGNWWHCRSVFSKIKFLTSRDGRFDVIEGPLWDGECYGYSTNLEAPLVVRLQTPVFKSREILGRSADRKLEYLEKKSLDKATLIASISQNIARLISDKYKINPKKIIYSPLGINFPKINKAKFNKNSYKLLYVSRLETRKGTKEFIEALPKILTNNVKITVDIVGKDHNQAPNGTNFYNYFKQIIPKDLQPRVTFHGFASDKKLEEFYKNCDVFILPSRYESFGLVFLEAMSYGKPVIGTKIGGIPEIVNNKVGLLVDVNNPEEISAAVLKIFASESLRKDLGENSFKFVRDNFSVEKMVSTTIDIYTQAIDKFYINK